MTTTAQPSALAPRQRATTAYAELSRRVRAAGLLERCRGYYWWRMSTAVLALAAIAVGVVLLGESWLVLLLAGALALVVAQCAFLGHDGAHRQIFASARANEVAGRLMACLASGLSYGWWLGKHNRHHQAPNTIGIDGDLDSKALAFTEPAADAPRGRLASWLIQRQGWFFFPLLLLEGANLHVESTRALLAGGNLKRRGVDIALIGTHWAAYLTLLLLVLSPGKAAAFLGVHLALLGVAMGGAFAPNHTGMPVVPKTEKIDFLSRQVLMSRDVRGGWLVHLGMGGLDLQIEHHLFPSMPRPHLRRAQPIVRAFCAERGISYAETSYVGAMAAVVAHLNRMGLRARDTYSCPLAAQLR